MTQDTQPVFSLDSLHKSFGPNNVLRGMTLSVKPGEVYGFLGRNGAGKSTTIRILMGIHRQDAGTVELFGETGRRALVRGRQRVGYVAQEQHFYPWMTCADLQNFVSGMYPRWSRERYSDLMKRFELPSHGRIGDFSGGMKARLALSMALAIQPEILVLDEPTAGMDPVARREFLDLVNEQALSGDASVFFSTHVMDDIEAVATRVGVLEEGSMIFDGPLQNLVRTVATFSNPVATDVQTDAPMVPQFIDHRGFTVLRHTQKDGRDLVTISFNETPVTEAIPHGGWRREEMSLEDVFIATVGSAR